MHGIHLGMICINLIKKSLAIGQTLSAELMGNSANVLQQAEMCAFCILWDVSKCRSQPKKHTPFVKLQKGLQSYQMNPTQRSLYQCWQKIQRWFLHQIDVWALMEGECIWNFWKYICLPLDVIELDPTSNNHQVCTNDELDYEKFTSHEIRLQYHQGMIWCSRAWILQFYIRQCFEVCVAM